MQVMNYSYISSVLYKTVTQTNYTFDNQYLQQTNTFRFVCYYSDALNMVK